MKKCPYCAEEIQDEAKVCRYCHSSLNNEVGDSSSGSAESTATRNKKAAPTTLITLFLVFVGVVIVYFLISNQTPTTASNNEGNYQTVASTTNTETVIKEETVVTTVETTAVTTPEPEIKVPNGVINEFAYKMAYKLARKTSENYYFVNYSDGKTFLIQTGPSVTAYKYIHDVNVSFQSSNPTKYIIWVTDSKNYKNFESSVIDKYYIIESDYSQYDIYTESEYKEWLKKEQDVPITNDELYECVKSVYGYIMREEGYDSYCLKYYHDGGYTIVGDKDSYGDFTEYIRESECEKIGNSYFITVSSASGSSKVEYKVGISNKIVSVSGYRGP